MLSRIDTGSQVGAMAKYSCEVNYTLVGVTSRTCTVDGTWTGRSPSCGQLYNQTHLKFASLVAQWVGQVTNKSKVPGSSLVFNVFFFFVVADCLSPPLLRNGRMVSTGRGQRTPLNTVITYSCDEGFTLNGASNVTCGRSSQWLGQLPTCEGRSVLCILYTCRLSFLTISKNDMNFQLYMSSLPLTN